MGQKIPNIEGARALTKDFLNKKLVELMPREQAMQLINPYIEIHGGRTHIKPELRDEYLDSPQSINRKLMSGEKVLTSTPIDPENYTVRDMLTDYWREVGGILLADLNDARGNEAKILRACDTDKKATKSMLDLLLALDAFADGGQRPAPRTMQDGLAQFKLQLQYARDQEEIRKNLPPTAKRLEDNQLNMKALFVMEDIVRNNDGRIPDYIPEELRARVRAYRQADKTTPAKTGDFIREIRDLMKQHGEAVTADDYKNSHTSDAIVRGEASSLPVFLEAACTKLQDISDTLAISPGRRRTRNDD